MTPNEKRDKSWAQEQLEDPEMFEAFCRELKREAARCAAWRGGQESSSRNRRRWGGGWGTGRQCKKSPPSAGGARRKGSHEESRPSCGVGVPPHWM